MATEAILVNGASEILKKLSVSLAKEIGLAWGVKDELQKLKKTLDMILAVLPYAEKKQVKSEVVRLWLVELKDIAYEVEDVLDEYAYKVMHQSEMTKKRDKIRNFFSSLSPIVFRLNFAHEIKNGNEKLIEFAKRKEKLGLQTIELGMPSHTTNFDEASKLRETDSFLDLSLKIVGRKNDKANIINMLLYNDPHSQGVNIQVIPIVGMGGLGKTTLAHLIYNDDKVKSHFELKMWVCVSNDFDVKTLFLKTIESITNNKCDDANIDVLARQLQQHLSGKKYLLVLDDVWNKKREEWVNFRKHLQVGANGSKVIITTRSDNVASIMGGELRSYRLRLLDENESWYLFKERAAFGHVGGVVETPIMTKIGKELVEKCGGLPLAIIFLGSLLRGREEIEWKAINEDQIWNQSSNEDESRILPVLKLSYDHLPSHLKQCFSYFSLFPKTYPLKYGWMILLWMAEGFILQPPEKLMQDVGIEYFNILLNNSFFQDLGKDEVGQILWFNMHYLVHDLAENVAGDRECLSLAAHENLEIIPNTRRLRLHDFNEGMSKTVCKAWQGQTKLRTLLCSGTIKNVENAFDSLKRLRVLDLSETPNIEEIPSSLLENLMLLRFLNLSNTQITKLPKSLTRLYHLQTLGLLGCVNLKELPEGIGKLINLRYLLLPDDINLPREIGQLSSLITIYPFNVGNKDGREGGGSCGIEVLEGLNFLYRHLKINDLRNVRCESEAQRANLMGNKCLTQICLSWHKYCSSDRKDDEYNKDEAVLEALQPHPNLKELRIDQYFGVILSGWMGDPSSLPNLMNLQLNDCRKCKQLVGFGKLPSLKELRLRKMDGIESLGNEFYYNNSGGGGGGGGSSSSYGGVGAGASVILFPSLKEILLSDMGALEEWDDIPTVSCFPCLEEIYISNCPNLRITPTRFPCLKKLVLRETNGRLVVPLITELNLNSLETVELEKITELMLLPYRLLQANKVKVLRVVDCLDFQGFLPSKEKEEVGSAINHRA